MMNHYHEESGAETPFEIDEIGTPTSGTFTYSSPRMNKADSAGASRSSDARETRSTLLQVDTASDLAAYTYGRNHERYAVFFWQSISNDYQNEGTKHSLSPLAAVTWSNGLKGAVYYLNEIDLICEQVTTDSGKTWHGGSLTGWSIPARSNSDLAAVVTWESLRCMEIFVYFQDENNRIRELRFESEKSEWYEDSPPGIDLLKGLSGTSIVCGADSTHGIKRWMYSQSTAREVQQCRYEANRTEWILEDSKIQYFSQCFDRKVRLGYCIDQCSIGIYAHDGSKVLEKVWQRGPCWKWKDQVILPMSTGTATIKENFVVLLWPQDVDNTVSEVHLFSTEGNVLHDYLVGPATGGKFSLI